MSFYTNWLDEAMQVVQQVMTQYAQLRPDAQQEIGGWQYSIQVAQAAKIIRMSSAQAQIFLGMAPAHSQDFGRWLQLPFPYTFIEIPGGIRFDDYIDQETQQNRPVRVDAVMLRLLDRPSDGRALERNADVEIPAAVERVLQVWFFTPDRHGGTTDFVSFGYLIFPDHLEPMTPIGVTAVKSRMLAWAIHAMNFLTSPSVKLSPTGTSSALQKARQRRGKAPLPGWYEITYRKVIQDYTRSQTTTQGYHHRFRYDVRGHFKTFQRGPMAGRVIWCPAHQRGLAQTLYKPKSYVILRDVTDGVSV